MFLKVLQRNKPRVYGLLKLGFWKDRGLMETGMQQAMRTGQQKELDQYVYKLLHDPYTSEERSQLLASPLFDQILRDYISPKNAHDLLKLTSPSSSSASSSFSCSLPSSHYISLLSRTVLKLKDVTLSYEILLRCFDLHLRLPTDLISAACELFLEGKKSIPLLRMFKLCDVNESSEEEVHLFLRFVLFSVYY